MDEIIAQHEPATNSYSYAHRNHQGSVIAVSKAGGQVASNDIYTYSPYGEPNITTGFPYRYTGRRLDAETGLYYYRARYYDAQLGRFLQTDPIGYEDQMNLYAYVGNDPVNKIDPTGMYGRGSGFTDDQWKKFDKAQQQAAGKMEKHANKLSAKADKLDAKGKPGGDALRTKAESFRSGASALRSDGSDGKVANAVDSATYQKLGGSATGAAFVQGNGPVMVVNAGNAAAWTTGSTMAGHVVTHESLHTAGLNDQRGSNGQRAYKYGSDAQQDAYKELKGTPQGDINPDHLADEVY